MVSSACTSSPQKVSILELMCVVMPLYWGINGVLDRKENFKWFNSLLDRFKLYWESNHGWLWIISVDTNVANRYSTRCSGCCHCEQGRAALHLAAGQDRKGAVMVLISAKCDINAKDVSGPTALVCVRRRLRDAATGKDIKQTYLNGLADVWKDSMI
jgi:hypothetical protein